MSLLFTIAVIAFLILVNALYVAAEFAAVSVRKNQIKQMADQGNSLARAILPTLMDTVKLDRYIAACQFGITISSLILGAYGQAALADILFPLLVSLGGMQDVAAHSLSALSVLIGLTVLQVILGELMPKSLALQFPRQSVLYTYPPMKWSLVLFSWFVDLLNGSGLLFLKIFRLPPGGHRHIHSPEEIDMLLAESREGGMLDPDEHERFHGALTFGQRSAGQLMIPRRQLVLLDINADLETVTRLMEETPHSHIPVYEGETHHIVGILHVKDLSITYAGSGDALSLRKLVKPLPFVPETMTVDDLLSLMRGQKVFQVFVLDEYGAVVGMVTMDDLMGEVLGDLSNEFEREAPSAEVLEDGCIRLPGMMRAHKADLYLTFDKGYSSSTVGGCLVESLGRFPKEGEVVEFGGRKVRVENVEHHFVGSLLLLPKENGATEETHQKEGF